MMVNRREAKCKSRVETRAGVSHFRSRSGCGLSRHLGRQKGGDRYVDRDRFDPHYPRLPTRLAARASVPET